MNKSKTKKLALLTTVVILVLCFIPAVQGTKTSNNSINIRPIEDWLYAGNPFGSGTGYLDPDSMLSQRCLAYVWEEGVTYEGYIVEKLMGDGSLHITVKIRVEGMPMAVRDWIAEEWIFVGVMDFTYRGVIILEKEIPGGHLYDWDFGPLVPDEHGDPAPLIVSTDYIPENLPDRVPGADLAPWWVIYWYQHELGGHFEWLEFKSKGSGNFIEPGWNPFVPWDPVLTEEEGNVKCHQIAIYGYNLPENNPNVYQWTVWSVPEGVFAPGGPLVQSPLLMPEMWPAEYVKFY